MIPADEIAVPARGALEGVVRVPSSKSLTHRALALAALANGPSVIEDPLVSDDTVRMARALRTLGVRMEWAGQGGRVFEAALDGGGIPASGIGRDPGADKSREDRAPWCAVQVEGRGGSFGETAVALDAGGSGTAMRFLTALASLASGDVIVDGSARLRERPVGPLVDALGMLGIKARSLAAPGFPPIRVRGGGFDGGTAHVPGSMSSQFVSALLLVAPLARGPASIEVLPPLVSAPYVDLTLRLMKAFSITPSAWNEPHGQAMRPRGGASTAASAEPGGPALVYRFPGGGSYRPVRYQVPPDASAAGYFFAAAAVTGGRVRVEGVRRDDPQGDALLVDYLEAAGCTVREDTRGTTVAGPADGCLRAFDLDLGPTPDLAPTLGVLAMFADGVCRIRGAAHLRLKESDRIAAVTAGLARLGAGVEETPDGFRITPACSGYRGARIETYDDHRVAMAFAVAGLVVPGVRIANPACVAKSFPGFWEALFALRVA